MRILLSTDLVGGVWRYTGTLVRELVDRGHECAVAAIGDPADERSSELPAGVRCFQREHRLEWMPGGIEDVEPATRWLEDIARRWRPDVVHLNHYGYALGSFPAPVLVVAHSDLQSWFDEVRGIETPAGWEGYTKLVRAGIEAADVVVAPTAYQSGRLARHYGQTAVKVIHNGTLHAPPTPAPPASERTLVLVAGRAWDEAKGIALLDRALAELGEDAPEVHLAGPLEGPAGEVQPTDHLVTHGEVDADAMDRFYRDTRLYVGPSLYEPFGLSPLEAAGHGCALLLSGIGSFRELWTGAARFFEPLHPDVLAHGLQAALSDPESLDEVAERARERARDRYTAARMADEYIRVYARLTGQTAAGPASDLSPSVAED